MKGLCACMVATESEREQQLNFPNEICWDHFNFSFRSLYNCILAFYHYVLHGNGRFRFSIFWLVWNVPVIRTGIRIVLHLRYMKRWSNFIITGQDFHRNKVELATLLCQTVNSWNMHDITHKALSIEWK